jgi:uncharacterized membrane protein
VIPTVILVIMGIAFSWIGYANHDDTVFTVGIIVLIVAAFIGILTLADRYRHRP